MKKIAYIGELNPTNTIISEQLRSGFDVLVNFHDPRSLFNQNDNNKPPESITADIIIVDLNTYTGMGSAPSKIKKLSQHFDNTPLLVLHHYENEKFITPLITAGATAVLSNTPAEQELHNTFENIINKASITSSTS